MERQPGRVRAWCRSAEKKRKRPGKGFHRGPGQRDDRAEARARPPVLKAEACGVQPQSTNSRSLSTDPWSARGCSTNILAAADCARFLVPQLFHCNRWPQLPFSEQQLSPNAQPALSNFSSMTRHRMFCLKNHPCFSHEPDPLLDFSQHHCRAPQCGEKLHHLTEISGWSSRIEHALGSVSCWCQGSGEVQGVELLRGCLRTLLHLCPVILH